MYYKYMFVCNASEAGSNLSDKLMEVAVICTLGMLFSSCSRPLIGQWLKSSDNHLMLLMLNHPLLEHLEELRITTQLSNTSFNKWAFYVYF